MVIVSLGSLVKYNSLSNKNAYARRHRAILLLCLMRVNGLFAFCEKIHSD